MIENLISVVIIPKTIDGKSVQKVIINKNVIVPFASGTGNMPVYKNVEEVYIFENLISKSTTETIME